MTYIAQFADSTIATFKREDQNIFRTVARYMDAAEIENGLTGAEKLKWVLAILKNVIEDFDFWSEAIITFITKVKDAWNRIKDLFK